MTMNSRRGPVDRLYGLLRSIPVGVLWLIVIVWSVPSVSLFLNSWRSRDAQRNSGWWTIKPGDLTIDNYDYIFNASAAGTIGNSLINSMAIAVPATIIPIAIATFAAYGFA